MFYISDYHRLLHSLPTRRSSDLEDDVPELRIGEDLALFRAATTSHWTIPFSLQPCPELDRGLLWPGLLGTDRKSTRLNSSHVEISYAVLYLKKKTNEY